ncbi:unnamed protein product, partial [Mesorhabditis belari]|uniref:Uncharacterized protein n=1 Tax=Mesorhabditis belari TaxID=2138241 RepID=A0AAF3EKV8_9BILA
MIEAHVGIMRPPKFDPTETYPVLLDVYGGPNSYINSLETPWDFLVYLCSTRQLVSQNVTTMIPGEQSEVSHSSRERKR